MTTITIELCAEDRARLDKIIEALGASRCSCHTATETAPERAQDVGAVTTRPTQETHAEAQDAPAVTRADVQQKVVKLAAAGRKAEVRDIVKAYAPNVSGIPDAALAQVWAALTALEG